MAHETEYESSGMSHDTGNNAVTLSFAFLAGGGIILMLAALIIGVIDPDAGSGLGLMFVLGLLAMISGMAAWVATVRPFTHFDDINVPQYHGHHHEEHHDEEPGEVNVHEPASLTSGTAAAAHALPEHTTTTVVHH